MSIMPAKLKGMLKKHSLNIWHDKQLCRKCWITLCNVDLVYIYYIYIYKYIAKRIPTCFMVLYL